MDLSIILSDDISVSESFCHEETRITSYNVCYTKLLRMLVHPDIEGLAALLKLCAEGKLKISISQIFPLSQGATAHTAIETGRTKGKILLRNNFV